MLHEHYELENASLVYRQASRCGSTLNADSFNVPIYQICFSMNCIAQCLAMHFALTSHCKNSRYSKKASNFKRCGSLSAIFCTPKLSKMFLLQTFFKSINVCKKFWMTKRKKSVSLTTFVLGLLSPIQQK